MYNIAIIGAGQLGSRHLQSLANSSLPLQITVIDPFQPSLDIARIRWLEVHPENTTPIHFHTDIRKLPAGLDVVIVATNANIRRSVVEQLLQHASVRYFIFEKVLFQSLADYAEVQQLLIQKNIQAYINCPRRMYPFYQFLKEKLQNHEAPLQCSIQGNVWGMGCNTIHFLDLFFYLRKKEITKSITLLDDTIHEAKRDGYVEFTGQYLVENEAGDSFLVICRNIDTPVPSVLTISSNEFTIRIVEADKRAICISKDGSIETYDLIPLFQSQLTSLVVDELLSKGICPLTPYHESTYLHQIFLYDFLEHYNHIKNTPTNTVCPIT